MNRFIDWLFPWRSRIRLLERAVAESPACAAASEAQIRRLTERVSALELVWDANFTVYGDVNRQGDSHIALLGRDKQGPLAVIRKVRPGHFAEFVQLAKRLAGPAKMGGIDGPPGIDSIAGRTWRDTGRAL